MSRSASNSASTLFAPRGGEGGGHTGDVPTTVLIPTVAKLVQGHKSPLTGASVQVIAAGGLFNGQSVAAALMLGASAVWIGTRFILSPRRLVLLRLTRRLSALAGFDDNIRTIIFTVRHSPIYSCYKTLKITRAAPSASATTHTSPTGEENRSQEIKDLTSKGIIPVEHDFENLPDDVDDEVLENARPFLMGKVAAVVTEKKPAKAIVDELVTDASAWLQKGNKMIAKL